jgi:hypothetical protein
MAMTSIVFLAVLALQQGVSPREQASSLEWELVRTVSNEQGGTMDVVVVLTSGGPALTAMPRRSAVADTLHGPLLDRPQQVPTSARMPVPAYAS